MRFVHLDNCKDGMILGKSVYDHQGTLLLRRGGTLKQSHIEALQNAGYPGIYLDDEFSKGLEVREVIDPVVRSQASAAVQGLFHSAKFKDFMKSAPVVEEIEEIINEIIHQISLKQDAVIDLINFKAFDDYTFQHSVDVGILSLILGRELKLKRFELISLGKAAFFHDIGKMFVPKNILNKPSALTREEFDEVKNHCQYGHNFLKEILKMPKYICDGALSHHERYEGGGYPHGLVGENIPLFARIIAVTDVYDAITSRRVYKDAMNASEAYEYVMSNVGKHFDPKVAAAFLYKIAPYPVGTLVLLSNGRKAMVMENTSSLMMRPLVKLVPEGTSEGEPEYINLARELAARNITIVGLA